MNQYHKLHYHIKSSHKLTKLRAVEECISASQDIGNPEKAERSLGSGNSFKTTPSGSQLTSEN